MNICVISYSMTGNNDLLATSVAGLLGAQHLKVTESKTRKNGTIAFDMLLSRVPKVLPLPEKQDAFDMLLFVGPVWMGQAAFPLRVYLGRIRKQPRRYAYISISGGALGDNPKLAASLEKQTRRAPDAVVDLHIADLLPPEPKPTMADTSAYRVSDEDAQTLAETAVQQLNGVVALP